MLGEPGSSEGAPDNEAFLDVPGTSLAELGRPVVDGPGGHVEGQPVDVVTAEGEVERAAPRLDLPEPGPLEPGLGPVVVVDDRRGESALVDVAVEVLDAEKSGLSGVPLVVRVEDPSAGVVTVSYGEFADAGGWGFWDRMVVRMYPECVSERPKDVLCSVPVELSAELLAHDRFAETVSFRLDGLSELVTSSRDVVAARESDFDVQVPVLEAEAQRDATQRLRVESATTEAAIDDASAADPSDTEPETAAEGEPESGVTDADAVDGAAADPEEAPTPDGSLAGASAFGERLASLSSAVLAQGAVPSSPVAGGGVILAMSSGSSGDEAGNLGAVPQAQLGEWSVSPGSGNFSWAFPIPVPDVAGGLVPDLRLSYASSAVDRVTLNENGQAPSAGLGWDFPIGSIRRNYWSCGQDGSSVLTDAWCWHSDNATIVLNGQSGELVKVDSHGTEADEWRLVNDNGWNIYRYWGSLGANASSASQYDDNDQEFWVVAVPDGTRYFFGRFNEHYNSTLTAPVFGDDAGEPCNGLWGPCYQAYEWRLDAVTDVHGNWITYDYDGMANYFSLAGANFKYDRAARLTRIEYGKQTSAPSSAAAVEIEFPYALREDGGTQYWPDDLDCDNTGGVCTETTPTFWEKTRLGSIEINVQNESGSGYRTVDTFTLNPHYTHYSTETLDRMLLSFISHEPFGDEGSALATRVTTFGHSVRQNLATAIPTPLNIYRLDTIWDVSMGGTIVIDYGQHSPCTAGQLQDPPSPAWSANTNDCFPKWVVPSSGQPGFRVFNKWLVETVTQKSNVANAEPVLTTYTYDDANAVPNAGAGWADDDNPYVPSGQQSYSQWRGYADATVIVGNSTDEQQRTDFLMHRGLGVNLPGTSVADPEEFAGRVRTVWSSVSTNGTYDPVDWTTTGYERIAEHTNPDVWFVHPETTWNSRETSTGSTWTSRVTRDVVDRRVVEVVNEPTSGSSTDATCTRTDYHSYDTWNFGARHVAAPYQVRSYEGTSCTGSKISRTLLFYDGSTTASGATFDQNTKLNRTKVRVYDNDTTYSETKTEYDDSPTTSGYGHVTATFDARNTETSITPTVTEGFITQITTTVDPGSGALALTSTATFTRGRGSIKTTTDVDGLTTTTDYDRLGRPLEIDHAHSDGVDAIITYTEDGWFPYTNPNGTNFTTVHVQRLHDDNNTTTAADDVYVDRYSHYDGLGRLQQVFGDNDPATNFDGNGPFSGTVVTATNYDSAGRVEYQTEPFHWSSVTDEPIPLANLTGVEISYHNDYDGLGRITDTHRYNGTTLAATTTFDNHPDKVVVTDPENNTVTTTYNRRGLTASIDDGAASPEYTYDIHGRLTSVTDPSSVRTNIVYDYTYWHTQPGTNPSWTGRQYSVTDTDRGTTRFETDRNGNIIRVEDDNPDVSNDIRTSYDNANRPVRRWDHNIGNTVGNGRLAEWVYDPNKARLDREFSYTDQGTFLRDVRSRDAAGRPETVRWDIPAIGGFASYYDFDSVYNDDGTLASRTYPASSGLNAETVKYTYDNAGRLDTVIGDGTYSSDTYLASTRYDDLGRPWTTTHGQAGNIIERIRSFDTDTGRLSGLTLNTTATAPATTYTMQNEVYAYDDAGSLEYIHRGVGGIFQNKECFENDNAGRLVQRWQTTATTCGNPNNPNVTGFHEDFTYNSHSQLTWVIDNTTTSGANDQQYRYGSASTSNADHQPNYIWIGGVTHDTFTYYDNGNLKTHDTGTTTRSFDYDAQDRLATATVNGQDTEYAYDASGQRWYTKEPDGTIRLYLDDTQVALAAGWLPATVRSYSTGSIHLATRNSLLTDLQYTFGNNQGSTAILVDDNPSTTPTDPAWHARSFDPYGDLTAHWQINTPQVAHDQRQFLNQYHDTTTDLTYLNARYYNPTTRLFTQPDPLRQETRPQATNAYGYALNNPTNYTDQTGLCPGCDEADMRFLEERKQQCYSGDLSRCTDAQILEIALSAFTGTTDNPNIVINAGQDRAIPRIIAEDAAIAWVLDGKQEYSGDLGDFLTDLGIKAGQTFVVAIAATGAVAACTLATAVCVVVIGGSVGAMTQIATTEAIDCYQGASCGTMTKEEFAGEFVEGMVIGSTAGFLAPATAAAGELPAQTAGIYAVFRAQGPAVALDTLDDTATQRLVNWVVRKAAELANETIASG